MKESEIYILISKVLSGDANATEVKQLEQWRQSSTENEALYNQILKVWEHSTDDADPIDVDAAWNKIQPKLKRKTFEMSILMRVAAVLLLAAGMGVYYLFFTSQTHTIQTAFNEQKQVELPDGSIVWLNENSVLVYDKPFSGNTRNVQLTGEAFFEVTKNPEKPFVIGTDRSEVKVLGTSFNLEAREHDSLTTLTVATGKVSFKALETGNEVIVIAGEKAVVHEAKTAAKTVDFTYNEQAWKTRQLVFNNTPMRDVITSLEKYFKVKFDIKNPALLNCHFTGTFETPKLKEILDVFEKTLQIQYEQKDKVVVLNGKGC